MTNPFAQSKWTCVHNNNAYGTYTNIQEVKPNGDILFSRFAGVLTLDEGKGILKHLSQQESNVKYIQH